MNWLFWLCVTSFAIMGGSSGIPERTRAELAILRADGARISGRLEVVCVHVSAKHRVGMNGLRKAVAHLVGGSGTLLSMTLTPPESGGSGLSMAPDWVAAEMPPGYHTRLGEIERLSADLRAMDPFGRLLWAAGRPLAEAVRDAFLALKFEAEFAPAGHDID